ncbi:acyltransferase family protein [Sphingomonas sp.]|uniref:acyltransferase family protein n=1 Tax=Sphingomonas sp. TaxID=28214 RepID=UPI003F6FBD86
MGAAVQPGDRLDWLDYARFASALVVMLYHYLVVGTDPRIAPDVSGFGLAAEIASYGPIAVFAFMLISGMVITQVAQQQDATTFAVHRIVRIYPLYLFAMILTASIGLFGPERFHTTWRELLANLFINAPLFGERYVIGITWTLVLEVAFYIAVFGAIVSGMMHRVQYLVAGWVMLLFAGLFLPWRLPLLSWEYAFIASGAVLALWYQRRNARLNLALLALSLVPGLGYVVHTARASGFDPYIGVAITLGIVGLFLGMRGRNPRLPHARRIGLMTYSLYLLHFRIGLTFMFWWMTDANKWWVVIGTCIFMVALSFLVDDVIEFRLRGLWKQWVTRIVVAPIAALYRRLRPVPAEP